MTRALPLGFRMVGAGVTERLLLCAPAPMSFDTDSQTRCKLEYLSKSTGGIET